MGQISDEKEIAKEEALARETAIHENSRRAERAVVMLEAYDILTEEGCAITDALADIRHLCRINGWNFCNLLRISGDHFDAEVEEEGL